MPALADDVVNEKVSVKEPGITNDGAQIVVDESGTTSVGGHTSLSGVVEVEAEIEIGDPETVSGHASVGTDAQGFGCTIESLEAGHCETF